MATIFDQLSNLESRIESLSRLVGDFRRTYTSHPQLSTSEQPAQDPLGILGRSGLGIGAFGVLQSGTIADSIPHAKFYRVLPAEGPMLECYALTHESTSPMGVAGAPSYQPQTRVLFTQLPGTSYGIILGALADPRKDERELRPDNIYQGVVSGLSEVIHQTHFQFPGAGGVLNRSARTPFDSVELGEFVRMSATGLLLLIDDFMAQLRVDEETGLFLFYMDQLARLSGHNLEIRSAGHSMEAWETGKHFSVESGFSFSADEGMGILRSTLEKFTEYEDPPPGYGYLEPGAREAISSFDRIRTLHGYLGQGIRQQIVAPPASGSWFYRDQGDSVPIGLSEAVWTALGSVGLRSSRIFTVGRRPSIVVPKRVRDRGTLEQPLLKAPGSLGSSLPNSEILPQSILNALSHLDREARVYGWESVNALAQDPEISTGSESGAGQNAHSYNYANLRSRQFLDPPTPRKVFISEDEGEVDIYPTSNTTTYLEDGSTVTKDGYGGTDISSGGNRYIDVPGDLYLRAGRRIVVESPEIIVKGHDNVDITCETGAIRTKSETEHVMIVANGGGDKGLLVDCRAESDQHGIVLKAENSQISSIGKNHYIRTTDNGDIILDSGKGDGDVIVQAREILNFVAGKISKYFGQQGEYTEASVESPQGTVLPGSLYIGRNLNVQGSGNFDSDVSVFNGHIRTNAATANQGRVSQVYGQVPPISSTGVSPAMGQSLYAQSFGFGVYGEHGIGTDEVLETEMKGSLRSVEEYGTVDYVTVAPPWTYNEESGAETWESNAVIGPRGEATYSFPGKMEQGKAGPLGTVVVQTSFIDTDGGGALPPTAENYTPPAEDPVRILGDGVKSVIKPSSTLSGI